MYQFWMFWKQKIERLTGIETEKFAGKPENSELAREPSKGRDSEIES